MGHRSIVGETSHGFADKARKIWLRHKLNKATRLMKKPELSLRQRIERDKIVEWLGEKGGWEGNELLRGWAIRGDVRFRPDPEILGKAIAKGGLNAEHLHMVAHASVSSPDFSSNYYFARMLAAECAALEKAGHAFEPKKSVSYFICSGAQKMVRFMQEKNLELVLKFERERTE